MNNLVKIDVSFEYEPKVYLYERKVGWYWKFRLPDGSWFYGKAPGKTEHTVRQNARKKEKEITRGFFTKKEVEKIQQSGELLTFEDALNQFIESMRLEGASPNYYKRLHVDVRASIAYLENKHNINLVCKLTERQAQDFRTYLLKKVKSEKIKRVTAFRNLNDIKRLFKWLKKRKRISKDPWVDVERISVPRDQRSRNVTPTADVLSKIMSANYSHRFEFPIKEFAYGLFRTGARKQELLYMEINDVDWKTGLWTIQPKECPTLNGNCWKPKYGKKRVTIMPKDVLALLKPLVERARKNRVIGYMPGPNGQMVTQEAKFIFTMLDRSKKPGMGRKVYRRVDNVRSSWGALFIAAGLSKVKITCGRSTGKYKNGQKVKTDVSVPYTAHDMRRGFNYAAKKAGMSLDDRAKLLGHGKEVNERHYCGEHEVDLEGINDIVNRKMRLGLVG